MAAQYLKELNRLCPTPLSLGSPQKQIWKQRFNCFGGSSQDTLAEEQRTEEPVMDRPSGKSPGTTGTQLPVGTLVGSREHSPQSYRSLGPRELGYLSTNFHQSRVEGGPQEHSFPSISACGMDPGGQKEPPRPHPGLAVGSQTCVP